MKFDFGMALLLKILGFGTHKIISSKLFCDCRGKERYRSLTQLVELSFKPV
jgi:hypothetical protein